MLNTKLIKIVQQIKASMPKHKSISTAESCTGGMLAAYLTAISGSSNYFAAGVVSYSNAAKIRLLSVNESSLEQFGAVSEEVAREMAIGSQKLAKSDIAISITGIAGPEGGSEQKPAGTVCFGIATATKISSYTYHLDGDRNAIREESCRVGLELLLKTLNT